MQAMILGGEEWTRAEQNGVTKELCQEVVIEAAQKSKDFLPTLSSYLNILIRAHAEKAVSDTAVGGETHDSELIVLSFDESVPYGKESLVQQLKATTYHEANHAARFAWIAKSKLFEKTLTSWAVWEGLATVCERDFGESSPKWSLYEDDKTMLQWLKDLKVADAKKEKWEEWAFKRKDGRNWLAYRVGTWILDRAMANSGKTVGELTVISANEIMNFAEIKESL